MAIFTKADRSITKATISLEEMVVLEEQMAVATNSIREWAAETTNSTKAWAVEMKKKTTAALEWEMKKESADKKITAAQQEWAAENLPAHQLRKAVEEIKAVADIKAAVADTKVVAKAINQIKKQKNIRQNQSDIFF